MKRNIRSITYRLERLEAGKKNVLPKVIVEYAGGHEETFLGYPGNEKLEKAIRTYGSDFAQLIDVILHPAPNRNIEDLES